LHPNETFIVYHDGKRQKPKPKQKPGPKEERLKITGDPERALRDFLRQKSKKNRKA